MLSYLRARLFTLLISLILSSFVIFIFIEAVPGDPASFMLGINATDETTEALRKELGLDKNIVKRYGNWISGMFLGDFGVSYTYRVPVQELILERLNVSLPLTFLSLLLAVFIAFPAGMIAAQFHGKKTDFSIMNLNPYIFFCFYGDGFVYYKSLSKCATLFKVILIS